MANKYLYSGAAGTGTGADWTNAYTAMAAALAGMAAGDTLYVADDHAETTAATITHTSPGTAASPCRVICARRSGGSVPPVSADLRTTATVSTTGASHIDFSGCAYCYGVTFSAGSAANIASIRWSTSVVTLWTLDSCKLILANTSGSSAINLGTGLNPVRLELVNTPVKFGNGGQGFVYTLGEFLWRDTAGAVDATGTAPTNLFSQSGSARGGLWTVRRVDLSAVGSGSTLVLANTIGQALTYRLQGCKLGASVAVVGGTFPGPSSVEVELVDCDSADTNYRYHKQNYQGTVTQETTVVRTGGASDGTNSFSRKLVSTANSKWHIPLESDEFIVWNDTVGSAKTVTVELVTDGVTLNNDECWLEAGYAGTSGYPLYLLGSSRTADALAAGSNLTTSTATWTTTGLSSPTKQKVAVTFTAQQKGWVRCRVCLAKASTTVYVDPYPVLS